MLSDYSLLSPSLISPLPPLQPPHSPPPTIPTSCLFVTGTFYVNMGLELSIGAWKSPRALSSAWTVLSVSVPAREKLNTSQE